MTLAARRATSRSAATWFCALMLTALLSIGGCAQTRSALEGSWTVIAGEHGGMPMDAMNGGTLRVEGDRFRIDTSAGNVLEGDITFDRDQEPAVMTMKHDSGLRWQAIYALDEGGFRMNYVDLDGPDPLPDGFRTSEETEATVVVLERRPD